MAFTEGFDADLRAGDMSKLPWPDGHFFADVMERSVQGEWRDRKKANEVELGTLVATVGHETGVPHHLFMKQELRDLFGDMEFLRLDVDQKFWFLVRKEENPEHGKANKS